ncbi:hypothetical protein GJ496_008043 [Pomphorhynchus laevis]|nr:hypothetical protein GJ496_008043 [Pomphorhynchus laevis]
MITFSQQRATSFCLQSYFKNKLQIMRFLYKIANDKRSYCSTPNSNDLITALELKDICGTIHDDKNVINALRYYCHEAELLLSVRYDNALKAYELSSKSKLNLLTPLYSMWDDCCSRQNDQSWCEGTIRKDSMKNGYEHITLQEVVTSLAQSYRNDDLRETCTKRISKWKLIDVLKTKHVD